MGSACTADIEGSNGQRKEFRIVGRANVPGRLSHSIATGKAKFGSDVIAPDMLSAKFLRSPYGRAKIRSLDIRKAQALPGVVDIVTWDDPDIKDMPPSQPQFTDPLPLITNEADVGVRGTAFFISYDFSMNPFNTTKCLNLKTDVQSVFTNSGRMYTSGATAPFNWDVLPMAEQIAAGRLGMDPIDIALKNSILPEPRNFWTGECRA